jgi:quinol monooxygenase YgiN
MRAVLAIYHRVADLDAFREVYDSVRPMQEAGGVRHQQVLSQPSDPTMVYITHTFDSREAAEAFLANPELKEAMGRAGVDASSLNTMLFDEIEAGSL